MRYTTVLPFLSDERIPSFSIAFRYLAAVALLHPTSACIRDIVQNGLEKMDSIADKGMLSLSHFGEVSVINFLMPLIVRIVESDVSRTPSSMNTIHGSQADSDVTPLRRR